MRDQTAGFAQVVVIAGLLVAGGVIATVSLGSLETATKTNVVVDRLADEVEAASAIMEFATNIATGKGDASISAAALVAGRATVRTESDGGKLNPLAAPLPFIESYLNHVGVVDADRTELLGTLAAARGASDPERAVLALYRTLLSKISAAMLEADFSSNNPSGGIDPHYASERVLRALSDLDPADVADILSARIAGGNAINAKSAYFVSAIPRYTLVATVDHGDGDAYIERIPIEITSAGSVVYLGRDP